MIMVYFIGIQPTRHYLEEHAKQVSWEKVVEIIFTTKSHKRKKDKFVIEKDGYYILYKIENKILYVINAKKK